jgi:hypothetical protein
MKIRSISEDTRFIMITYMSSGVHWCGRKCIASVIGAHHMSPRCVCLHIYKWRVPSLNRTPESSVPAAFTISAPVKPATAKKSTGNACRDAAEGMILTSRQPSHGATTHHDCCLRKNNARRARLHRRLPCQIHRLDGRCCTAGNWTGVPSFHAAVPHVPSPLLHLFHVGGALPAGDHASPICHTESVWIFLLRLQLLFRTDRYTNMNSIRRHSDGRVNRMWSGIFTLIVREITFTISAVRWMQSLVRNLVGIPYLFNFFLLLKGAEIRA